MSKLKKLAGALTTAVAFIAPAKAQQLPFFDAFTPLNNVAVKFGPTSYNMSGMEVSVLDHSGRTTRMQILMPSNQWNATKAGVDWLIRQRANGAKDMPKDMPVVSVRMGMFGMGHYVDAPMNMFEDGMSVVARQAMDFGVYARNTGISKDTVAFDLGFADRVFLVCELMKDRPGAPQLICTPNCVADPSNTNVGGICPPGKIIAPGRYISQNPAFSFPFPTY